MEVSDVLEQPPPAEFEENGGAASVAAEPVVSAGPAEVLPADFERLWKAANDSPQDFSCWTNLLQYCEQEGNLESSRKALEAFLARYPLCYGYWKKYADLERRAGNGSKAQEVCIQGLQAIPLSVDLWIHYINLLLGTLDMNLQESPSKIRSVFEEALAATGLDFLSDRLWDLYIEWEKEQGNMKNAQAVLDRVLQVPTQLYNTHYEKFKTHLNSYEPKELLSQEEYEELRSLCSQSQKTKQTEPAEEETKDSPPGDDESATSETTDTEELKQEIRDMVLARRDKMYQDNEGEVRKRWQFEEAIKRPYFHVKPLDCLQLRSWHSYLDWEIAQLSIHSKEAEKESTQEEGSEEQEAFGSSPVPKDDSRVRILFERCLIACALYEEFWTRYIRYLEPKNMNDTRHVFQRACKFHLTKQPNIHMLWATFEERHGDIAEARRILEDLEKTVPGLAVLRLRRAALERRAGQQDKAEALLQEAVAESKEKPTLHAFYSIKLARMLLKLSRNPEAARRILTEALEISPDNDKLHMNLLELELTGDPSTAAEAVQDCVKRALAASLTPHAKILLSQRGLQHAEDYSKTIESVVSVYEGHQQLLKDIRGTKRGAENGDEDPTKLSRTQDGPGVVAAMPHVPMTTPPPSVAGTDMTTQSGYGGYGSWYQPQYGSYGYPNTWNYNQGYYPTSQ